MALIECVDCGKEHSDQAPACLHCGRPMSASEMESDGLAVVKDDSVPPPPPLPPAATANPATASTASTKSANAQGLKTVGIVVACIVGLLVLIGLFSGGGGVHVTELSSEGPLFGTPTVTARLVNEGRGGTFIYWVTLRNSDSRHCRGSVFLAQNEGRQVSFRCQSLAGYSGNFTMVARRE